MLKVNRAGDYAWLQSPMSDRAQEDERLLGLIKHPWLASGSVYGHRKVSKDLRDLGERCSRHRVHRLAAHGLVCSMSRRGNCHDNAPVESFFGLLTRQRIRRRIYPTKDAARTDAFDYIEMFYTPKRRHGSNGDLSPVEFERRYAQRGS